MKEVLANRSNHAQPCPSGSRGGALPGGASARPAFAHQTASLESRSAIAAALICTLLEAHKQCPAPEEPQPTF
jgi:hypothetical protein